MLKLNLKKNKFYLINFKIILISSFFGLFKMIKSIVFCSWWLINHSIHENHPNKEWQDETALASAGQKKEERTIFKTNSLVHCHQYQPLWHIGYQEVSAQIH